jgi:hypothetical protein
MTKICPNCKNKNLDSSGFCQNCGEKLEKKVNIPEKNKNINGGLWNKQGNRNKTLIVSSIIGVFLIILISAYIININSTPESLTVTSSPTSNNIIILNNSTGSTDSGYYTVKGTVLNNNSYAANFVSIIMKAYNKEGKLIKEESTYANYSNEFLAPILAKTNGEFEISFEDPNKQIVRYELIVQRANKP